MTKYVFLAFTNPTIGGEEEYNKWYDEQHLADVINVPEDDTKKNNLPAKPQNLHNHPQKEIRLETQLPNE